ncbi:hypothetical protein [Flavobacterium daemonense]|uniref:hypothetical protein n=1 Tax=Flavobacterium daemonense TaxID=1393049 RepID=UPI00118603F4|nr:hypothetical protein [Flavobacterium daemonense]KAF2327690.1 hypothetical protein FND99_18205 [Flavobacterium daemonense]
MKTDHNFDYHQNDPDYIEQNILVDGTSVEDQYKQDLKAEDNYEFGESDPDYLDQNTPVDPDNYAREENPYQYQEEFIGDSQHFVADFEDTSLRLENIPNQERIVNEDDAITNDERKNDFDEDYDPDLDLEKDGDLDDDDTKDLDDFDAEHFPENHPRE